MNREGINNLIDQIQNLTAEKSKLCKLLLEHRGWLRECVDHLGKVIDAFDAANTDPYEPYHGVHEAREFHKKMEGL